MKVAITGAEGFIGTALCNALRGAGHELVPVTSEGGGILNPDNLRGLEGAEVMIHLAALVGSRAQLTFQDYYETNVMGTWNVVEASRAAKIPRLIYASSTCVRTLRNFQSVTKAMAETLSRGLSRQYGIDYLGLRLFNVYGPGQTVKDGALIPTVIEDIKHGRPTIVFGGGQQTRDFVYIDDVVKCFQAAVESGVLQTGMCVDVGTGWATKVMTVVRIIYDLAGKQPILKLVKATDLDSERWSRADTSACRERFGLTTFVRLQDGLSETWTAANSHKGG